MTGSAPETTASPVAMADLARTTADVLGDLLDRCENAEKIVARMSRTGGIAKSTYATSERHRLEGKAEGLRLAISYIKEEIVRG